MQLNILTGVTKTLAQGVVLHDGTLTATVGRELLNCFISELFISCTSTICLTISERKPWVPSKPSVSAFSEAPGGTAAGNETVLTSFFFLVSAGSVTEWLVSRRRAPAQTQQTSQLNVTRRISNYVMTSCQRSVWFFRRH